MGDFVESLTISSESAFRIIAATVKITVSAFAQNQITSAFRANSRINMSLPLLDIVFYCDDMAFSVFVRISVRRC